MSVIFPDILGVEAVGAEAVEADLHDSHLEGVFNLGRRPQIGQSSPKPNSSSISPRPGSFFIGTIKTA
jgi:hypothetical protein